MTTALIVVDVQNDFAHLNGSLYLKDAEDAVVEINELTDFDLIIYTKDWHPAETEHFEEFGGPWPAHCVAGTWGAEFHPELEEREDAFVVHKGQKPGEDGYSGFSVETNDGDVKSTELDDILKSHDVDTVVVVGLALDVCVKATALDAQSLGYNTTVLRNATAPVTDEGGEEAVQELEAAGVAVE